MEKTKQSVYEKQNGLRTRKELPPLFCDMIKELDEVEFHNFYSLIWNSTGKSLLLRLSKRDYESFKKRV